MSDYLVLLAFFRAQQYFVFNSQNLHGWVPIQDQAPRHEDPPRICQKEVRSRTKEEGADEGSAQLQFLDRPTISEVWPP